MIWVSLTLNYPKTLKERWLKLSCWIFLCFSHGSLFAQKCLCHVMCNVGSLFKNLSLMMWTYWLAHLFAQVGEKLHQMKVIVRLCQIDKDINCLFAMVEQTWYLVHYYKFTFIARAKIGTYCIFSLL
jgi:hypothetical protein